MLTLFCPTTNPDAPVTATDAYPLLATAATTTLVVPNAALYSLLPSGAIVKLLPLILTEDSELSEEGAVTTTFTL